MLKRLELIGFKSFAEKTTFEFGPGITAVVGPNGSGKSNVVDAIRWILGEQSAKSLRGGEMTDVIFNGSATRKSLGLAEVTLTLDNARRVFDMDAEEVEICRRVYRDGTGEYLVNRQPARLKDIKEIFLGTGAGADSYCIIAQGKVEQLLNASTQERRQLFEEAAGISRFKVKKLESQRKLEQVSHNLARARDVLEELNRQLQAVRLQAAKAERYQEYTGRLRELRLAVTLGECDAISRQLRLEDEQLEQARVELAVNLAAASGSRERLQEWERQINAAQATLHARTGELATVRERLANLAATAEHETASAADLERQLWELQLRDQALHEQIQAGATLLAALRDEVAAATAESATQAQELARHIAELDTLTEQLRKLRLRLQRGNEEALERHRTAAQAQSRVVILQSQSEQLGHRRQRLLQRQDATKGTLSALDMELQALAAAERAGEERLTALREELSELRQRQEVLRDQSAAAAARASSQREERGALASRIALLTDLERTREGLGAGVRDVLEMASGASTWAGVVGTVADLLAVGREVAPLIDLALGERAQAIVVRDADLLERELAALGRELAGRVTFLPLSGLADVAARPATRSNRLLDALASPSAAPPQAPPGWLGSAADFVACPLPQGAALIQQLLGTTLLVTDLATARTLGPRYPGCRFITRRGELLEANGLLTVGTHHAAGGLLSRKSELRELLEASAALDRRLAAGEAELEQLRVDLSAATAAATSVEHTLQAVADEVAHLRTQAAEKRQHGVGLSQEIATAEYELRQLDDDLARLTNELAAAHQSHLEAEAAVRALHEELERGDAERVAQEARRQQAQDQLARIQVALGKTEERRQATQHRWQDLEAEIARRTAELQSVQGQTATLRDRLAACREALAQAEAETATGQARRSELEAAVQAELATLAQLQNERESLQEAGQTAQHAWRAVQERVHALDKSVAQRRQQLEVLAQRLREEWDLDLAALYADYQAPQQPVDAAAAQAECAELRKKIARLGSVNPEAVVELKELEGRHFALKTQHDDLVAAKEALDTIIAKINEDSRKLFLETFTAVRGHFQELFRKLFGGGMADVLLENPGDVLESGIEIVARPPGKEMRHLSLMSGGEKALTAVALLLAVFRNKPSPFCILDEVDAPLDEANVGRFAGVLREFAAIAQFILVTHSRKSMAAADVLYGVTMQEAGVSKRVSVRLENSGESAAAAA